MRKNELSYSGWRMPTNAVTLARAEKNAAARGEETNDLFVHRNPEFKAACEKAGIPATSRQAGKWRRKEGLAYQTMTKLKAEGAWSA